MQVYLVGGAVRDRLLGRTPTEHDWVVVGATPEEMQRLGYRAVGRDFPVFLHPATGEEYALARLERKVGPGYRGFVTEHSPQVTLEQDLERRDLRINAMAQRDDGTIIDPFGGRSDLEQRLLRHVSPAFAEDPVRILRVARFCARFAPLGFRIAPETLDLMRQMVQAGETAALVPERVWRELERALGEPQPEAFFATLAACGALYTVLPELGPLWIAGTNRPSPGVPALQAAARAGCSNPVRMAAFMASLPAGQIQSFCERLRVPNEYRELALLSARLRTQLPEGEIPQPALMHDPAWLLGLLENADALRRPGRFAQWLAVLGARASASGGSSAVITASTATLQAAAARATAVRLDPDAIRGLPGLEIAQQLRHLRLAALGVPRDD